MRKRYQRLKRLLKDKSEDVRREAIYALREIGDEKAVPALIEILEDEDKDEDVRSSATQALSNIGDERSVPALIEALNDKYYLVQKQAAAALSKIRDNQKIKGQCPSCKAVYKVDGSKIPERGTYARCPKCQERFFIKKEDVSP